ncbi:hypothetical protein MASR2M48_04360 [Spirochaetota bacterium]
MDNARYVTNNMDGFYDDIRVQEGRHRRVEGPSGAEEELSSSWRRWEKAGMFDAIENGACLPTSKRPKRRRQGL